MLHVLALHVTVLLKICGAVPFCWVPLLLMDIRYAVLLV